MPPTTSSASRPRLPHTYIPAHPLTAAVAKGGKDMADASERLASDGNWSDDSGVMLHEPATKPQRAGPGWVPKRERRLSPGVEKRERRNALMRALPPHLQGVNIGDGVVTWRRIPKARVFCLFGWLLFFFVVVVVVFVCVFFNSFFFLLSSVLHSCLFGFHLTKMVSNLFTTDVDSTHLYLWRNDCLFGFFFSLC
jgi:hypothetical protein